MARNNDMRFVVGKCYNATGVMKETGKRFVVCIGREGDEVCFGFCDAFATANARSFPGLDREFVRLKGPNDHLYNVSAALPLDEQMAMKIIESMEGLREHV